VDDSKVRHPVTKADLQIVKRARELLDSPLKWNRADNRVCPLPAKTVSLYCALQMATIEAFDMDYYLNRHIPMVLAKLGVACKTAAVEQGLAGATPGSPPTFTAMGHLYFDSVEAFQAAFGPHAGEIMGDIPNYTSNRRFK